LTARLEYGYFHAMKKPREQMIRFLASDAERKAFDKAAERMGLTLSGWIRLVALSAAEAGKKEKGK
jgi:antitoxin component of RelBE/YafQ-DinJ toxin-antitoxin module